MDTYSKKARGYLWLAGIVLSLAAGGAHAQSSEERVQQAASPVSQEHRLVLFNTHTNERLDIVFRRGDEYVPAALAKLDYFLRDHNTNEALEFDPHEYDLLYDLTSAVGKPGGEIDIVCGYRTPSTNAALRERTNGVAVHSLHIQAKAIDLRMPGVKTLALRRAALALKRGGVGYYPHSDFIHVDTGRVTQWCFDCPDSLKTGD
jgi:uncharacterized protein YcbK (DUF882 family)